MHFALDIFEGGCVCVHDSVWVRCCVTSEHQCGRDPRGNGSFGQPAWDRWNRHRLSVLSALVPLRLLFLVGPGESLPLSGSGPKPNASVTRAVAYLYLP